MRDIKLSKILFWLLLILLPVNLGLHFITSQAYVTGLMVDYLIPTLYVQNIVAVLLICVWYKEEKTTLISFVKKLDSSLPIFKYIAWFIYTVLLSTFIAPRFISSFTSFLHLFLYSCVCLYIASAIDFKRNFLIIRKIFLIHILCLSILGFLQFFNQSSVFNNYTFLGLGEQPYSYATPGIDKENFFGVSRIPSYGLFTHPNVFGGFLSLIILWVLSGPLTIVSIVVCTLGIISLFFTLSYFAYASFVFGILLLFISKKFPKYLITSLIFVLFISFSALFISKLDNNYFLRDLSSFYRRVDFLNAGYSLIKEKPFFGVGYNMTTVFIENHYFDAKALRFVQPVHNNFVLVFVETGILSLILYILVIGKALEKSFSPRSVIFLNILQIIFLFNFDHYFWTIHQTQLLFWILIGLSLSNTSNNKIS